MASSAETTTSGEQKNPEQVSNSKMIQPTVQDDETDSCFEFIKRRNLAVKSAFPNIKSIESAPTSEEDAKKVVNAEEPESSAPKVVVVKPIAQFSAKVSPIKPVKSSPFKQSCIDKIAENLKALQEQKKTIVPKVAPTVAVISKQALIEDKLKNIKLSPKEIAHQLILLRCKKIDNAKRLETSTTRTSLTSVENQK